MGTLLNIAKGIDAVPSSQIPTEWDRDWFSSFINVWLARADVRNATTDGNIIITGNSAGHPYISLNSTGGPALTPGIFSAGITVTGGSLTINGADLNLDGGTTGVQTATLVATNKPGGASVTTPAIWFPVKDSNTGLTYWVPGFAN